MEICSLSSGSKGNCILVTAADTNILIDLGITYSDYLARTKSVGFSKDITGILITHCHGDHIKGMPVYNKHNSTAIYAGRNQWASLKDLIGAEEENCRSFAGEFSIDNVDILPFPTPHDVLCCGYSLTYNNKRVSIVTDIGCVTDRVLSSICGSDTVMIEANYDEDMLRYGKYPYPLKQRILGNYGHLSNVECGKTAVTLYKNGVKKIILCHLSENNNMPDVAFNTVSRILKENGIRVGKDLQLVVATQNEPSAFIEI